MEVNNKMNEVIQAICDADNPTDRTEYTLDYLSSYYLNNIGNELTA